MLRNNKSVLIAGGDLRQVHLANLFSKYIKVYAVAFSEDVEFDEKVKRTQDISQIDIIFDYVVLPVPALKEKDIINTPLWDGELKIEDVLNKCDEQTILFAGKVTNELESALKNREIKYYDYLQREELAVLNAVPTAEGTIGIILSELPITIYGMNILILGGGRISKVLRTSLANLGANVSVCARNCSDLAWIKIDKCKEVKFKQMPEIIDGYDVIINTIPVKILDEKILSRVNKHSLIIDLASKPGGIDFANAKKLGLKVIWALSLPGKVAPITAGEIIFDTITNIIDEMRDCVEYN